LAVGLTVEATPGHYHVFRDGKPLRKENGMPFTLPFSPDTTRWRKAAILEGWDIAALLGQRTNAVEVALHRALERLRVVLEP
jgi:hypothetical protein